MKRLSFSKVQQLGLNNLKKIILGLIISFYCSYAVSQNPELPVFITDSLEN